MTTTTETGPAIELVGLTKRFGRATAVDRLSLSVTPGSTFGLIGPNGAGKTTTIKMLMGVLTPTAGQARALGIDALAEPLRLRQRVGYVPESHHVDRWMRVAEVVGFCRSLYGSWNDQTCREMLDLFELDERKKVRHLSKGMLVKLSLVLAVSHEPEVLVLDEPMAGLDPLAREEFLDGVLRTICERGQTVLFSTHSLDDVQRLADTVGILYGGRLLVHRNIEELLATTKRIRATLTDGRLPDRLPPSMIWQRVEGREWLVTVGEFTEETVRQLRAEEGVEHVEVIDLGLEELFKDFIRGQRAVS
ncbi:MAG TPA: ABC transporter ATP-binding protein [Thermoguttaceae bacterium]|nr:ABC transporter ATP-binding protein [Thermoguttaceae bacterium]